MTIYLAQFVIIYLSIFRRKTQPFIDTVPPLNDNFINAIRESCIQQYQLTVPVIDEIFFVRIVLKYPQRVCKSTSEKIHEACELLLRKKVWCILLQHALFAASPLKNWLCLGFHSVRQVNEQIGLTFDASEIVVTTFCS